MRIPARETAAEALTETAEVAIDIPDRFIASLFKIGVADG